MSHYTAPAPGRTLESAAFLPLSEKHWNAYRHFLEKEEVQHSISESVLGGCLGIHRDLLARAARIAVTFRLASEALHATLQENPALAARLLRPLAGLPHAHQSARTASFFLRFLRMDFFLEEDRDELRIIEVNSGGGGLPDFLRCTEFLRNYFPIHPPGGFHSLTLENVLRCLLSHCSHHRPGIRTFGLVPAENGNDEYVDDYIAMAHWIRTHTTIQPVFLTLTKGTLALWDHPAVPCKLKNLSDLDAIFNDWFEDLPCLERVEQTLIKHDILPALPRSDLLFESKSFLTELQRLPRPATIPPEDWALLQAALPPSFPLNEYKEHLPSLWQWPGIVLKMNLDCAGEHVFIFDFACRSPEFVLRELERTLQEGEKRQMSWTVQKLVRPRRMTSTTLPPWLPGSPEHKFDLMTYLVAADDGPHVFFGSRQFSREKIDELSREGQEDGFMSPVCSLP